MNGNGFEEYRLLFFQPDPESGERICVGLLVSGSLIFDPSFSRVQSFSKRVGPNHLRLLIDDMRENLARSNTADLESTMKLYAPMFQLSSPRKIATPIDQKTLEILVRRFVNGEDRFVERPSRGHARKEFSRKLRSLALGVLDSDRMSYKLIENATSTEILGAKLKGVRRVALAVRRESQVVLLDGVDLNLLHPQDVLRESTNVVRTFWQYRNAPKPYGETVHRLAVIFNGVPNQTQSLRDIHAFVSSQFDKESDQKIEAQSAEDLHKLAGVLASAAS